VNASFTARLTFAAALFVAFELATNTALAQDRTAARRDYLKAQSLEEQAARLEEFLRYGLEVRAPKWTQEEREREAFNLSFVLLMNGVTFEAAMAVQDAGVDVIHAIAANARPLVEQSLLADVVVVADVIEQQKSDEPGDGFGLTSAAVVRDRLKGTVTQDTLILRQRAQVSERNIVPEIGGTYVLLLSRGMYRFRTTVQRTAASAPEPEPQNVLNIYRIYRLVDGRILWDGYTEAQTTQALDEIRRLDGVLQDYYSAK
jgi:hypothetical protein